MKHFRKILCCILCAAILAAGLSWRAYAEESGDGETGSIEAGKAADLIVCAKDPLADLSALRTLSMVIKDGYRVEHPAPKKLPEVERELDKFL